MDALLWLDFETSGLSPETCSILECAAFLDVKGHRSPLFNNIIKPSDSAAPVKWDPFALEMHKKSGLYERFCNEAPGALEVFILEQHLVSTVDLFPPKSVMLAGNSVHFDRAFIRRFLPRLDERLHHRHMDVSCISSFLEKEFGIPREVAGEKAHRAKADIEFSMGQYDRFKSLLKKHLAPDVG